MRVWFSASKSPQEQLGKSCYFVRSLLPDKARCKTINDACESGALSMCTTSRTGFRRGPMRLPTLQRDQNVDHMRILDGAADLC